MPVLRNIESGLAENLPQEVANSALKSGTHEIPLISPKGERGSATPEDAAALVAEGYRQPKTEELKDMLSTASHTGLGHQVAAGIEGLGRGVIGPASDLIATATGSTEEDLRKHKELYPVTEATGEAIGTIGSAIKGVGLGGTMTKAAERVLPALSKDASFIAKVANTAGRGAIENAIYQASDETSKMIMNDPEQTAQTAIANVGLSALLGAGVGGGLGAVGAGFDGLMGSKAGKFIEDFKGRMKEHLDIPSSGVDVENPSSIYKSDIFGEGMPMSFEKTPGGRAADALIRNGLEKQLAGGIGAGAGSVLGHPILGYLFGEHTIAPMIKKILPAIVKPLLEMETSPTGLKSAVSYVINAVKGENAIGKAAASVFGESTYDAGSVDGREREKLKKQLQKISDNQEELLKTGHEVGHYMPDHASQLAGAAVRNAQYLNSLKPSTGPEMALDGKREISSMQDAQYNRALDIAENPLIVMKSVKDGNITLQDITHMKAMYPAVYSRMTNELVKNLIDKKTDKGSIPYKTKLGLSMFMGQSLDSSMTAAAILASQGMGRQQAMQPSQKPKSMDKLSKLPEQAGTMTGSREAYRSSRH